MEYFNIFDFMNEALVILAILITMGTFVVNLLDKKIFSAMTFFSLLLLIITVFVNPYYEYKKAMENISLFKSGKSITCISGIAHQYHVNRKDWKVRKYHFYQKSSGLMIKASSCEK